MLICLKFFEISIRWVGHCIFPLSISLNFGFEFQRLSKGHGVQHKTWKNHRSIFDRKWIRKLPILLTTAKLKTFWYSKKVYFLFPKKFYKEWPYVNPNEQKTKVNIGYFTLLCKRKHCTLITAQHFDDLLISC